MILYHGIIYDNKHQNELIESLYSDCLTTLSGPERLNEKIVINACNELYLKVIDHQYDNIVLPLLHMLDITEDYFFETAKLFSKEGLEYKYNIELGNQRDCLPSLSSGTKRVLSPLGILFHIAAGNIDALPAYSVIEGLLAGNINILKLPTGDSGLSVKLLSELIKIEPKLKEYIYVFDVPSTEIESIRKLASIANGIVVWGGDAACKAARDFAPINTKIICWGHKLSFAYASKKASDDQLRDLAHHICATNQVLCSSCQGIYFDTNSKEELIEFGRHFFDILSLESEKFTTSDIGMTGKNTIQLYADSLDTNYSDIVFKGKGFSVVIKDNQDLELSYLFRNVWIKSLNRKNIVKVLHNYKNHLQSVALLCNQDEKDQIANEFMKAGLVRITNSNPSRMFAGEAHDGTYALREYTKIIEID